jgi:hypothetical protein
VLLNRFLWILAADADGAGVEEQHQELFAVFAAIMRQVVWYRDASAAQGTSC